MALFDVVFHADWDDASSPGHDARNVEAAIRDRLLGCDSAAADDRG